MTSGMREKPLYFKPFTEEVVMNFEKRMYEIAD